MIRYIIPVLLPTILFAQDSVDDELDRISSMKRQQFLDSCNETLTKLDKLDAEIQAWSDLTHKALDKDNGVRFADNDHVRQFILIYGNEESRPNPKRAQQLRRDVTQLRDAVQAKHGEGGRRMPPNSDYTMLASLDDRTTKMLATHKDQVLAVTALLKLSPTDENSPVLAEAMELVRLQDIQKEQQAELKQGEELRRLANDPRVLNLFREFLSEEHSPNPWAWHVNKLGYYYLHEQEFEKEYNVQLKPNFKNAARDEFYRRKDIAEQELKYSLWDLYKALGQYRREAFLDEEETDRFLAAERAKPRRKQDSRLISQLKSPARKPAPPPANTPVPLSKNIANEEQAAQEAP